MTTSCIWNGCRAALSLRIVIIGLALALSPAASGQSIVFVDQNAAAGGDGSSWTMAFADLQDAFDLALTMPSVHEVWIAHGVYHPDRGTGDKLMSFRPRGGLTVLGGFAGTERRADERDPAQFPTCLDGDLMGNDVAGVVSSKADNSFTVLDLSFAFDGLVLDGLIVQSGAANGSCCVSDRGAGVIISASNVNLTRCTFRTNEARFGGGVFIDSGVPRFTDCTFESNQAIEGGAVCIVGGTPVFTDCKFESNAAEYGGGASIEFSGAQFIGTTFQANIAQFGGGISVRSNAAVGIWQSDFLQNLLEPRFANGGAMYVSDATIGIADTDFMGQFAISSSASSSVMRIEDSTATLTNVRIANNFSANLGVRIDDSAVTFDRLYYEQNVGSTINGNCRLFCVGSSISIRDSVFAGNNSGGAGPLALVDSATTIERCLFHGNAAFSCAGASVSQTSDETVIRDTVFEDNDANGVGALCIAHVDSCVLERCTFDGNTAVNDVGGVHTTASSTTLRDCEFVDNRGGRVGGIQTGTNETTIDRCRFDGNTGELGGAIQIDGRTTVRDSVFVRNSAFAGGAIYFESSFFPLSVIHRSTIVSNVSTGPGPAVYFNATIGSLDDCIVWNNRRVPESSTGSNAQCVVAEGRSAVATRCLIGEYDGVPVGFDNFDADPMLVSLPSPAEPWHVPQRQRVSYDLRLQPASPAIDRGGLIDDSVTPSLLSTDAAGQARVAGCRSDLGAFERQELSPLCRINGLGGYCGVVLGSADDCDRTGIPDACEIADGTSDDCNENGIPDVCEISTSQFEVTTFQMPLVIGDVPIAFNLLRLPESMSDVEVTVHAAGWLASRSRFLSLSLNDVFVDDLFVSSNARCNSMSMDTESVTIDRLVFNALVRGDGDDVLTILPSSGVQACQFSRVEVQIVYDVQSPTDINANGILDACEELSLMPIRSLRDDSTAQAIGERER
ncbi:MAG: right-handed parallel beta-helix repeat-containing protein [Planctomycetota bacterium]